VRVINASCVVRNCFMGLSCGWSLAAA
jgi:hypothetical protein